MGELLNVIEGGRLYSLGQGILRVSEGFVE